MMFQQLKKTIIIYLIIALIPLFNVNHSNSNKGSNMLVIKEAYAKNKKAQKRRRVKMFALNFKDVEISEFVNIMSQLIQKNIILDDNVKGKITISSAKKVPVSQAYAVMKSILEIKGLAIVETANLIKIIPIKEAVKKNIDVVIKGQKIKQLSEDRTVTFLQQVDKADAQEIANTLKQLKSQNTDIIVYPELNTIIFSGNSTEINGLIKIARELDKFTGETEGPDPVKGNIHVIHLQNATAEDLANVLSRIPFSETAKIDTSPVQEPKQRTSRKASRTTKTQYSPKKQDQTKLSIIANKDTNSLIITATREEYKQIRRIIDELDTVREQVFIEALIMEVSAQNNWGFGINWMLGYQSGQDSFGGSSLQKLSSELAPPASLAGKNLAMPLTSGFQLGYIRDASALGFALLNATASRNDINIISTPQILTIDNQEAELNVGEEIPVLTNNRISDTGTQNQTFDYKTVGMKLKITPHITDKKRITLDLYQEVNSVLGETQDPLKPPRLGKRDIKTKVTVIDGRTIVVGGLIRNDKSATEVKVPVLGDIPILGWLFKHKSVEYVKKNLLIFITPHIVTKEKQLDSLTKKKIKVQKRMREKYLKDSNW